MAFSFRNLFRKREAPAAETENPAAKPRAKHEKGGIVLADSGSVREVAREMIGFEQLLKEVQIYMSNEYAAELYAADKRDVMKQLIKQFMKDHNYYIPNMPLADAAERLYVEMAEYSFITPYLQRKDIEEININAWNDIQIIPSHGRSYKLEEHFTSPQHAIDVVRRLLHNNKLVFDASRPIVTGYLGKNTRITAVHTIIVGEDIGVAASIRIVNANKMTMEQFFENDMCTPEMHELLTISYNHGISQVIAGGTGSGKTTLMSEMMSHLPNDRRLITIEKSVREFDLIKRDSTGRAINNVLHFVTHDSDDESKSVTIQKLLTTCLTMNPDSICVAEMKNEEAWEAQEAARTGHTVLTTVHASNIYGIYRYLRRISAGCPAGKSAADTYILRHLRDTAVCVCEYPAGKLQPPYLRGIGNSPVDNHHELRFQRRYYLCSGAVHRLHKSPGAAGFPQVSDADEAHQFQRQAGDRTAQKRDKQRGFPRMVRQPYRMPGQCYAEKDAPAHYSAAVGYRCLARCLRHSISTCFHGARSRSPTTEKNA